MEGPLSKWTNVMKGWQYRWFVLDDSAGLLSYYTSKDKMVRGARRGCVRLRNAVVGIDDDDDSTFTITVDAKTFHFQAHDRDERETWIRALEDTILRHALAMTKRWDPSRPPPTMADFDKKLTESDAYLQLLIDQARQLERHQPSDEEERRRCLLVLDKLNTLLETVKHAIVLLQIAKNTAFPANDVYQPCNAPSSRSLPAPAADLIRKAGSSGNVCSSGNSSDDGAVVVRSASTRSRCGEGSRVLPAGLTASPTQRRLARPAAHGRAPPPVADDADSDDPISFMAEHVLTGIEVGREVLCSASVSARCNLDDLTSSRSLPDVPVTSYSSSEDEDFFDADDYTPAGPKLFDGDSCKDDGHTDGSAEGLLADSARRVDSYNSTESSSSARDMKNSSVVSTPPLAAAPPASNAGGVDYDALYDEDDEDDQVSMESHGFIIQHLISQVKIGMDLTKVVLPTFILERRSLLEMYADFFAHPDLFCSIPHGKDARQRMVTVLRWYLSAFHAGRRSEVAKKPYNPIIGEVFRCHWDVPGEQSCGGRSGRPGDEPGKPLRWVRDDQLAFVAEQVSHHPPISAFYAENIAKRISFCGHIWTKSKFLGLSVCVYNIGQGCVSVLDHDEEYIINFPSGYGRSILTVPWVELGGSCQITCSKTGYNANVEFLTKPFYGGKKHRVSAEVFSPGEKKPFLTVDGEWNGSMTAKWSEDGRTETFIDTRSMGIVRKQVRPIAQQDPNESRALWKECTAGLKYNNIEAATEAKSALEQKQREEAKQRKEAGEAWQTKQFSLLGENWVYYAPLGTRMSCGGSAAS
ncbi:oxysterol-binding protein-related protein 9 isoform X2 [Hyalella azteca]|uniref:Oxysterol-binding protein n=1 Tax=Hyalella azteca TaxID=294128 RepID=A0A979FGI3_HYAAZ|nr:oxysterol-binding protein-related protein 9 isoform X2 [Hyalella azteca]